MQCWPSIIRSGSAAQLCVNPPTQGTEAPSFRQLIQCSRGVHERRWVAYRLVNHVVSSVLPTARVSEQQVSTGFGGVPIFTRQTQRVDENRQARFTANNGVENWRGRRIVTDLFANSAEPKSQESCVPLGGQSWEQDERGG